MVGGWEESWDLGRGTRFHKEQSRGFGSYLQLKTLALSLRVNSRTVGMTSPFLDNDGSAQRKKDLDLPPQHLT